MLYELAEPDTLARGMRELLVSEDPPLEPVVVFANEGNRWLPRLTPVS